MPPGPAAGSCAAFGAQLAPELPLICPDSSTGRTEAKGGDLNGILTWNTHIPLCFLLFFHSL